MTSDRLFRADPLRGNLLGHFYFEEFPDGSNNSFKPKLLRGPA